MNPMQAWRWVPAALLLAAGCELAEVFRSTETPGLYMIIDLSCGTDAASYPVTYLPAVPHGGWTDEYKTAKLVMRKIPKATFMMGSQEGELVRQDRETQHQVTLTKAYYIGVFEVTQRQWELVMGNRPSYFTNAAYYATRPVEQVSYYDIRENPANYSISLNWPESSHVHVNSFMGKLRAKTGISTLDLPTEAQWECACRAGTTTELNTGYDLTSIENDLRMNEAGRYTGNSRGVKQYRHQKVLDAIMFWRRGPERVLHNRNDGMNMGTAKTGSYLPNAWGLYDMHGNVHEWCLDWVDTYPSTVTDPLGSSLGEYRVLRSGGWDGGSYGCRSASRVGGLPGDREKHTGFRAARTLP